MVDQVDARTSIALGRGSIEVIDAADLVSDRGVPLSLEKGDQAALVIGSTPCCSNGQTKAVPAPSDSPHGIKPMFDTAEHVITVWGLSLQTESSPLSAASAALPLAIGKPFALTYGQIVALGGDFYGDPKQPVCTAPQPIDQFQANFDSMAGAASEVQAILAVANYYEFGPISNVVHQGGQPSGVYAGLPTTGPHLVSDEDRAFDKATGGTDTSNGRYLSLAFTNFDHFSVDAITCYTAGHLYAQTLAAKAKAIPGGPTRAQALLNAYAANAFADHFLTDLFAAGHMRTPRQPLFDSADNYLTRVFAGLCAKQMHDEDNKFGLWVTNDVGDRWVAYGDARYRDTWNAAGRVVMKAAVQQSMNDIWTSFEAGEPTDPDASAVLRYTAKVIRDITMPATGSQQRDDRHNWSPLFWRDPKSGTINRRNELFDPSDRTYCKQGYWPSEWGLTTTVAQLKAAGFPVYMPKTSYRDFPPIETGMTGELGWPPDPGSATGPVGATGPTLRATPGWSWSVDGASGPTHTPDPVG